MTVRDVMVLEVRYRREGGGVKIAGAGCCVGVGVELVGSLWITK